MAKIIDLADRIIEKYRLPEGMGITGPLPKESIDAWVFDCKLVGKPASNLDQLRQGLISGEINIKGRAIDLKAIVEELFNIKGFELDNMLSSVLPLVNPKMVDYAAKRVTVMLNRHLSKKGEPLLDIPDSIESTDVIYLLDKEVDTCPLWEMFWEKERERRIAKNDPAVFEGHTPFE